MATPFDQAFAPFQLQAQPAPANVLEILNAGGPIAAPMAPETIAAATAGVKAPTNVRPGRERKSLIDILGGIADTVATVGGADPLYQMNQDAAAQRARTVDLDAMRDQQFQMQQAQGAQNLEAGAMEMAGVDRERIGNALAAAANSDDPVAVWGQVAEASGLPPEKAAQVGAILQNNPEMASALAQSFGYAPPKQGSAPKEMQIYAMLQQQDPELAGAYLRKIADPNAELTPYQAAQLALAGQKFEFDQFKFANPQPSAGERTAATKAEQAQSIKVQTASAAQRTVSELRQAFNDLKAAGGINAPGQTGEGRIGAWVNQNVPFFERVTNPAGFSAREKINTALGQGIQELVPLLGGIQLGGKNIDAGKELEFWRNAIASSKDYDAAMASLDKFDRRISGILSSADTPEGAPAARAPARGGGGRPAAPRAAVDPQRAARTEAIRAERARRGL